MILLKSLNSLLVGIGSRVCATVNIHSPHWWLSSTESGIYLQASRLHKLSKSQLICFASPYFECLCLFGYGGSGKFRLVFCYVNENVVGLVSAECLALKCTIVSCFILNIRCSSGIVLDSVVYTSVFIIEGRSVY